MAANGAPASWSTWRLPLAFAAATLLLGLALATCYPLVDPDEGRNAEVAREMMARHDFVIPTLAGMPYLDKPPALFWASAAAMAALGRHPWAARLPAVVAAALTVALVAAIGTMLSRPDLAYRASTLLLAAPLFFVLSAYVIFDMPLTLCVTVVWTNLARELTRGPSLGARLTSFAAVGLGLLLKGPVMLAWTIGGSLGAAACLRSTAALRWLREWRGWALALAMAGGWFALACARHPEYPRYAFVEETFERLSSGSFHREQPLWFVPVVLVLGALPWSLTTPWLARLTPAGRIAAGFVLFAAVFFTLSRSKLVTYLLPAIPPLAWIASEAWSEPRRARGATWRLVALYGVLTVGIALVAARFAHGATLPRGVPPRVTSDAAVLAAGFAVAALAGVAMARRGSPFGFVLNGAVSGLLLLLAGRSLAGYADSQSGAPLARALRAQAPRGRVRYEYCYSPGTDLLLGRTSALVSPLGLETTSNYQVRYRERLIARGMWTALDTIPATVADVVVRPAHDARPDPAGMTCFYRDHRFAAWRAERGD